MLENLPPMTIINEQPATNARPIHTTPEIPANKRQWIGLQDPRNRIMYRLTTPMATGIKEVSLSRSVLYASSSP